MPTLYTTLRAQHRHSPPRLPPPEPTAPRISKTKPLLAATQAMVRSVAVTSDWRSAKRPFKARKKILIVGAGLGGLCAAYELQGLRYDVKVFEARDRVGGRVHSLTDEFINGKTMEGGGELIGSNHPLWNSYAQHFGLRFSEAEDYGNSPIRFGTMTLTFEQSRNLTDELEKLLKKLNDLAERIVDPFEPWANSNARRLDRISAERWIRRSKCSRLCKKAIREMLETDNGVAAAQQSLLGLLAMVKGGGLDRFWTDTEVYRCKGGNQQLAERFFRCLNKSAKRVILKAQLTSIERRGKEIWAEADIDGKHEKDLGPFDDVILAIPPSVWDSVDFKDAKLARKLRRPPRMGANVKYLMRFKRRFWEDFSSSPNLTEDGPVDLTWETTEADEAADYTMVAFSGAGDAMRLAKMKSGPRDREYNRALDTAYPGIKQQIKKRKFMNWPKEPWTKASYYFPRLGEVTRWGPFWHAGYGGWLHFAGEHTCYAFMGYMEGALSSGYRLARRLAVRDGALKA
jgi:monoamine oxidase